MGLAKNGEVLNKGIAIDGESVLGIAYQNEIIWKKESGLKIPTFQDGTDEEIAATLEKHYSGEINIEDYWHVGDTRTIHLNAISNPNSDGTAEFPAQDIIITIMAINHHNLKENIGIRDKAALTVQTEAYEEVYINLNSASDTVFTKWSNLPLRTWMNGDFLTTCFSPEMQNMIKETKHNRLRTYNMTMTEEVVDKLFLPSYPEIFGTTTWKQYIDGFAHNTIEGTQWDKFKTQTGRIKYKNGRAQYWWTGSASSNYSSLSNYTYCWIRVTNFGYVDYSKGQTANYLAPAFCL